MKRLFLLFFALSAAFAAVAQSDIRYGYLSLSAVTQQHPLYAKVQAQIADLEAKYAAEANYNEANFRQQFADYLQGQKDFPESILLKRQRDLQETMERSLAFRHEADSLLAAARRDLTAPIAAAVQAAIHEVGLLHGYECILNTDTGAYPFLHPAVAVDVTEEVVRHLSKPKVGSIN